jgi:CRP/FNR family cyclic AMP-dependent transcriptional regulator
MGAVLTVRDATAVRRPFLDRLDPLIADRVMAAGTTLTLAGGDVIATQDAPVHSVGVLLDGLVKITSTDRLGHTALLEIRGPGELIGLVACCGATVRSSTATALGPAMVTMIEVDDLRTAFQVFPQAGRAAAEVLAERVSASIDHRLRASRSVSSRLAHCLVALAREYGTDRGDGAVVISFPLSQDELAAFVDSSRDAVAKTLMRWRRMKLVETGRRSTVVLDIDRLADHIG